ncbi:MAG: hypothetical protein OXF33_01780 [Rhodospirillales bacterium]|nr:hypothetical protein [Rhodospirillales bacterium]
MPQSEQDGSSARVTANWKFRCDGHGNRPQGVKWWPARPWTREPGHDAQAAMALRLLAGWRARF